MALISQNIAEDGFQYPIDSVWLSTFGEIDYSVPPIVLTGPRYWVAPSTSNWSNTTNWSLTSGGVGGASVPTIQNVVVFDIGGDGSCQIDDTVYVRGMLVSGYIGTIYQNSYQMRIDSSGGVFWSGNFEGSGSIISVIGNLNIGGMCQFNSTDSTLSCDSTFIYNPTSGFFSHNNGTISLDSSGCMLDTFDMNISKLQFNTNYARVNRNCFVEDQLVLKSGSARHLNTDSTIHVLGDIYGHSEYNQWTPSNNLSLLLDSTTQQNINNENGCIIPTLYVDKSTSEQIICYGESPLKIKGDFLIYDGTFNTNNLNIQVGI